MDFCGPGELEDDQALLSMALHAAQDFLVTTFPLPTETVRKLFYNALFVLPLSDTNEGLSLLPNSKRRFCLDLSEPIDWFISRKKMKRLSEFNLVVKRNFVDELKLCTEYHSKKAEGTWLEPRLIQLLSQIEPSERENVEMFCFSLVEKSTGTTVACTFGFLCGSVYHDYTMCTLVRDERGCGTLLTKLAGYVLQQSGVKLWYWGNLVPYMNEYRAKYGAGEILRDEFYKRWIELRNIECAVPFSEVPIPAGYNFSIQVESSSSSSSKSSSKSSNSSNSNSNSNSNSDRSGGGGGSDDTSDETSLSSRDPSYYQKGSTSDREHQDQDPSSESPYKAMKMKDLLELIDQKKLDRRGLSEKNDLVRLLESST